MNDLTTQIEWFKSDGHLTADALNQLAEDSNKAGAPESVDRHVESCVPCQQHIIELRGTIALLVQLPDLEPSRSFKLSPPATQQQPKSARGDISRRFQSMLAPAYPAFRIATVAVFLLLVSVSAADFLTNRDDASDQVAQVMEIPGDGNGSVGGSASSTGVATFDQPASESEADDFASGNQEEVLSEPDESGSGTAGEDRDSSAAARSEVVLETPAADAAMAAPQSQAEAVTGESQEETNTVASGSASNSDAGEDDASMTQLPSTTAQSTESATSQPGDVDDEIAQAPAPAGESGQAVPEEAGASSNDGISRWRVAEIALVLLLAWLAVTWIGIERTKRKS